MAHRWTEIAVVDHEHWVARFRQTGAADGVVEGSSGNWG